MASDPDELGQDLTATYSLGPALGRGAFGVVHRARDVATGREVAVKLLLGEARGATVDRFLREAVRALTLSADGRRLISIADHVAGHELKVWDVAGRTELRTLTAPGEALTVDLAPGDGALVIGTKGGGVRVLTLEAR